jgi:hypothetical protein
MMGMDMLQARLSAVKNQKNSQNYVNDISITSGNSMIWPRRYNKRNCFNGRCLLNF